jgi:hypothetical protein
MYGVLTVQQVMNDLARVIGVTALIRCFVGGRMRTQRSLPTASCRRCEVKSAVSRLACDSDADLAGSLTKHGSSTE